MTRGVKVLVVILIILVGILASASGFFYAKSVSLEKSNPNDSGAVSSTNGASDTTKDTTTTEIPATATATSAVTQPAAIGNRPSAPTDTRTVAAGETMSVIAADLDMSWIDLAEANGLTTDDANKIKVGQVLIVPKNNQISYTVNAAKAQEIQTKVDSGKDAFRLSVADTAKSDAPSSYGLAITDTFTQKTIDATAGTATVTGTHNGKNYEIKLTQPVTKGAKGIWAIASIKLAS